MSGSAAPRLLVIEDDASILLGLRLSLEREGYDVSVADDGRAGLELATGERWDLVILDIMLPRINGYEILSAIRSGPWDTAVLVLSARSAETDLVMGLDLGADDYVTQPFSLAELLARVRAMLRRRRQDRVPWQVGDIEIDEATRQVRRAGTPVELTATEFDVLAVLVRARGRILSRAQIMDAVWGPDHFGTQRTVDNFIAQLRAKLEKDPSRPEMLLTARGVGYRLGLDVARP